MPKNCSGRSAPGDARLEEEVPLVVIASYGWGDSKVRRNLSGGMAEYLGSDPATFCCFKVAVLGGRRQCRLRALLSSTASAPLDTVS